ncbi:hypothetical protein KY366_02745 [Candidatus Woesearchaeota archaeon]|nr:hypothetical protein [Candidatus Woesearchaeota archaeon]
MASIISSKRCKNHVILSIEAGQDELESLNGKVDNICLIPKEEINIRSSIYEKGRKGCTKYFLIPKTLRKNVKLGNDIYCSKLNLKDKLMFTFITNYTLTNENNSTRP